MEIGIFISVIYIILFMGIILFSAKIKLSKKDFKILFAFFILALSILAFCINPPIEWDLSRHFRFLDQIRNSNLNMLEFIFKSSYESDNNRLSKYYVEIKSIIPADPDVEEDLRKF